jgi:hypothetical protein
MGRKPPDGPRTGAIRRPDRMAPGGKTWGESPVRGRWTKSLGSSGVVVVPPDPGDPPIWGGSWGNQDEEFTDGPAVRDGGTATEAVIWGDRDLFRTDTAIATDATRPLPRTATDSAAVVDAVRGGPSASGDTGVGVEGIKAREFSVKEFGWSAEYVRDAVPDLPAAGLAMWLDAESLTGYTNGATLTGTIPDISGRNNHATVVGAPIFETGVTPTGKAAFRSQGAGYFLLPDSLWPADVVGGHVFVYLRSMPATGSVYGPWGMSSNRATGTDAIDPTFPYTGTGYQFGDGTLQQDYGFEYFYSPVSLRQNWILFDVTSTMDGNFVQPPLPHSSYASDSTRTYINGTHLWNTTGYGELEVFQRPDPPYYLFRGKYGTGIGDFQIAGALVYNRILDAAEAAAVREFLYARYGDVAASTIVTAKSSADYGTWEDDILLPNRTVSDTAAAVDRHSPHRYLTEHLTFIDVVPTNNPTAASTENGTGAEHVAALSMRHSDIGSSEELVIRDQDLLVTETAGAGLHLPASRRRRRCPGQPLRA